MVRKGRSMVLEKPDKMVLKEFPLPIRLPETRRWII